MQCEEGHHSLRLGACSVFVRGAYLPNGPLVWARRQCQRSVQFILARQVSGLARDYSLYFLSGPNLHLAVPLDDVCGGGMGVSDLPWLRMLTCQWVCGEPVALARCAFQRKTTSAISFPQLGLHCSWAFKVQVVALLRAVGGKKWRSRQGARAHLCPKWGS